MAWHGMAWHGMAWHGSHDFASRALRIERRSSELSPSGVDGTKVGVVKAGDVGVCGGVGCCGRGESCDVRPCSSVTGKGADDSLPGMSGKSEPPERCNLSASLVAIGEMFKELRRLARGLFAAEPLMLEGCDDGVAAPLRRC